MATKTTAEKVSDAIRKADRTKSWTAKQLGRHPSTLTRKLKGEMDFTITEIGEIAKALSVKPQDLLPPNFFGGK